MIEVNKCMRGVNKVERKKYIWQGFKRQEVIGLRHEVDILEEI